MLPGMSGQMGGKIKPPIDITPFTSYQSTAVATTRAYSGISIPPSAYTAILLVFGCSASTANRTIDSMVWNSVTATNLFIDQTTVSVTWFNYGSCWYFVIPPHGSTITSDITINNSGGTIGQIGAMAYLIENVSFTTPRDFRDFATTPFGDWVNVPGSSAVIAYICDFFGSTGAADTHTWSGVNEDIDIAVRTTVPVIYQSSGSIVTGAPDTTYDVAVVCTRVPGDFVMGIIGWR